MVKGKIHGKRGLYMAKLACMAEGHVWQGGMRGKWGGGGEMRAGEMATKADGTHATGMNSSFFYGSTSIFNLQYFAFRFLNLYQLN